MRSFGVISIALAAALSCTKPGPTQGITADAGAPASNGVHAAPASTLFGTSAHRCGECHGKLEDEWRESAHAHADQGALYRAMRTPQRAAECDRCHAPLRGRVATEDVVPDEGVTCDACHTMRDAQESRDGGAFDLRLHDNVKYGPLCDAKDHYFHKVGCSPMHGEARQCAACHMLYLPANDARAEIPVFTEFDEWRASTYGATGLPCQDCHMPGTSGEVAVGASKRPLVSYHGFSGSPQTHGGDGGDAGAAKGPIAWQATARAEGDGIKVDVTLHNEGAAHALPTGMPGRRIVLRVSSQNKDGAVTAKSEREFARVLVDASGTEVPFYEAVRVDHDSRLTANETRKETFDLAVDPQAGEVHIELLRREVGTAVRERLKVAASPEIRIADIHISFGAKAAGAGRGLPKSMKSTR